MGDTEINIWIMVTVVLGVWIGRLKWANRKLRRKLKDQAALPAPALMSPSAIPERDSEIAKLRERLAVIERITVDKENSLSRQIDELRHG